MLKILKLMACLLSNVAASALCSLVAYTSIVKCVTKIYCSVIGIKDSYVGSVFKDSTIV